jgi:hypothetical protein
MLADREDCREMLDGKEAATNQMKHGPASQAATQELARLTATHSPRLDADIR